MKWKCNRCGFEQPRHPATKPEEMPICTQHYNGNAPVLPIPDFVPARAHERFIQMDMWADGRLCGGFPQAL